MKTESEENLRYWVSLDIQKFFMEQGFSRWKVSGNRFQLRAGGAKLEVIINCKFKTQDNAQRHSTHE